MLIGRVHDAVYLGLPGNPVSSVVTFELFARPAIRRLQGASEPHRRPVQVRVGDDMRKPAGLLTYARAALRPVSGDLPLATTSGAQGSSMLHSLAAADCLLVLPAELSMVEASRPFRCDERRAAARRGDAVAPGNHARNRLNSR
jgi:molybdopterin molybdotransferase